MADHATPSQRVVGSTPTRRTNSRRPQPCRRSAGALSPDQTTGLVSGNPERAVPRSVVVTGDGAAGARAEAGPRTAPAFIVSRAHAMTATSSCPRPAGRGALRLLVVHTQIPV